VTQDLIAVMCAARQVESTHRKLAKKLCELGRILRGGGVPIDTLVMRVRTHRRVALHYARIWKAAADTIREGA
jgi:hypothetical protein